MRGHSGWQLCKLWRSGGGCPVSLCPGRVPSSTYEEGTMVLQALGALALFVSAAEATWPPLELHLACLRPLKSRRQAYTCYNGVGWSPIPVTPRGCMTAVCFFRCLWPHKEGCADFHPVSHWNRTFPCGPVLPLVVNSSDPLTFFPSPITVSGTLACLSQTLGACSRF